MCAFCRVCRWVMFLSFAGCGWSTLCCMSGAILVCDALGSAWCYNFVGGVEGWWWPWACGVCLSEVLDDLCDSMA